ncbi:AbrB/MazE/SpoVT family DNA-binding domain-containing protein [Fodinicola feengrottensis]|nr:AbrB/MazE/SpoVT family DNA-binding domain-containing protein [Fodinicola feengrottensis]
MSPARRRFFPQDNFSSTDSGWQHVRRRIRPDHGGMTALTQLAPAPASLNPGSQDSWIRAILHPMDTHVAFVAIQPKNGTVTIPAHVRRKFGLDKPGAQVEIVVREREIALIPHLAVPAGDAWFWTEGHQAAEREVDEDLAAGRSTEFASDEEFLGYLDSLESDNPAEK